jgi:histone chaperone ASF1
MPSLTVLARSRVEANLRGVCYLVGAPGSFQPPCRLLINTRNEYDQELDSVLVGPLPIGVNKFVFRADPPDLSRIPNSEIIGVTVILLSCSYEDREFVRVGYYVNNEYTDEALALEPPAKPVVEKVQRQILAEKPRVTRFAIKWYACTSLH